MCHCFLTLTYSLIHDVPGILATIRSQMQSVVLLRPFIRRPRYCEDNITESSWLFRRLAGISEARPLSR